MKKFILLSFMLLLIGRQGFGQIAAWQLNGAAGNEATIAASTLNSNLNSSSLARGSGLNTSALANAYGSTNFTASGTKANAISANKFVYFTINAKSGYQVSLSTLDARFRRSGTGPNSFRWQYSTDGTNFTDIGSSDISYTLTTTGGDAQAQINLSGITALQNVSTATTITIRLLGWGASAIGGTFAIGRSLTSGGTDYSLSIGGTVSALGGLTAPTLNADITSNDVDNNIDISFTDDATWRAAITAVKIGTTTLTVTNDYIITSGNLQLLPSGLNTLLTTSGSKSVSVEATNYNTAIVTQVINAGVATKLGMKTQPAAPANNGSVLATQPAVYIQDQYGNTSSSNASVIAAVGAGTWTLGGTTSVAGINGTVTFSGLTATSAALVNGATIGFTSGSLAGVTSNTFDIPAPAPTVNTSTGTLTSFGTIPINTVSTEKSYTVSGFNLTNDIVITPPAGFEISTTSGSNFVSNPSTITLIHSGGVVSSTTIYVRFAPTLMQAYSDNITNASSGATPQNVAVSGTGACAAASFPFIEEFDYTAGSYLTSNCWMAHSGTGTNDITVASGSINYPGYLSSGTFNKVTMAATGQDINRVFSAQTSGTIYASFLVNVSSATTTGDYFFNLGQSLIGSTFRGRVFVKSDGSGNIAFGIAQSTTTGNYTPYSYALNTPYLVVLRFDIVGGGTNDVASIYINPALNAIVPSTGWISNTDAASTDLTEVGSVALRQGGSSSGAVLDVDGIRISTNWADIVGNPVSYSITYDANGGTGTLTDPNSPYNSGTQVTVLENTFTRPCFTFDSWNTASDGTGTSFAANATFNISANTTLYAQWLATSPIVPTFTQLGPYNQGTQSDILPTTSSNGITGTWSPAYITTSTVGTTTYTFTPTAGQCATTTTMDIVVNAVLVSFSFSQDIGTALLVAWPTIPGASFYYIQYSLTPNGPWIGKSSTTNNCKIVNYSPGITYYWRVCGYNAGGYQIGIIAADNPYTTNTVSFLTTKDIGTTLELSWDDYSTWASSYVLQYKIDGGAWKSVTTYTNEKKISGLTPGTTYYVRIAVYKAGYLWGYSSGNTTFTAKPVTFNPTNISSTGLTLTWNNFADDLASWVSYSVLYYRPQNTTGAWGNKAIHSASNTTSLTGLTAGTTYDCYVIPYYQTPSIVWGPTSNGTFSTAGAKQSNSYSEASVYPNPFTNEIHISLFAETETNANWNIYDMTGKLVLSGSESISSGYSTLHIDGNILTNGVYLCNIITDGKTENIRLVKE